ncbi:MAG: hypothetical protein K2J83_06420 [Clostridia bacterium]|nr:hypothetical protein [Clostridia bacterium]
MSEVDEKVPEEEKNNNSGKVNFYRLDKSKPYKVEGGATKTNVNFMVVFGSVFLIVALIIAVVMWKSISENPVMVVIPIFMCVFGGVFLGVGISSRLKNSRKRAEEQAVLNDCVLTDAKISDCTCVKHHHNDSHGHSHTSYEYTLTYTFVDEELNKRTGTYSGVYTTNPQFYKGQYLMVAFNAYDSLIMREFTLESGDMNAFLDNEAARSDDDFDSLTGEELDIDTSKPLKSFDGSFVWLVAGLAPLGFLAVYIGVVGGVMLPTIFYGGFKVNDVGSIFSILAFLIMPCILIAISTASLVKYVKSIRPFKTVMKNNPHFTYGKMFASEKTFRGNSKKVVYCYIDKWGERHTEQTDAPLFLSETQGENKQVVVAYDAKGNSVVLTRYSFREK